MDAKTRLAIASYLDDRVRGLAFANTMIGTPVTATVDMAISTKASLAFLTNAQKELKADPSITGEEYLQRCTATLNNTHPTMMKIIDSELEGLRKVVTRATNSRLKAVEAALENIAYAIDDLEDAINHQKKMETRNGYLESNLD